MLSDDFAHLSAEAVAGDGVAQLFSCDQAKLEFTDPLITQKGQYKVPARLASALCPHHREIARFLQMKA